MLKLDKIDKTFSYGVLNYDYDTDTSGCTCGDDYCRCGRVTNLRLTSIDVHNFIDELLSKGCSEMLQYCVGRIVIHSGVIDEGSWELKITNGYYGQEVDGGMLNSSVAQKLKNTLHFLETMQSDRDMLFYALTQEYGYIIERLQKCERFSIEKVKKCKIIIGQKDHYHHCKLDSKAMNAYAKLIEDNYDLPLALCLKEGDEYRIIDGYHRVSAFNNSKRQVLKIIIGE